MENKLYCVIDYREIEQMFRKQHPDIKYDSFIAVEECGNDSVHNFVVSKQLDEWSQDNWQEIVKKKSVGCYQNNVILDKLCEDGLLKPGNYLVKVSW